MNVLKNVNIYSYYWSFEDTPEETIIHIYGFDESNNLIYLKVEDFSPYCYIELPTTIEWTQSKLRTLKNKLETLNSKMNKPLITIYMEKRKMYDVHLVKNPKFDKSKYNGTYDPSNAKYINRLYPFLFMNFRSSKAMTSFLYSLRKELSVTGLGKIKLKAYEHNPDISPILKFQTVYNLPTVGWIKTKGKLVDIKDKETTATKEYICSMKDFMPMETTDPVSKIKIKMRVLVFDWEAYSSDWGRMPDHKIPEDKLFQCSFVTSTKTGECKKYLFTLKKCDKLDGVEIREFKSETALLCGFSNFIKEFNPNIISGYNILGWDFKYMINRSKQSFVNCFSDLCKIGINNNKKCDVFPQSDKKKSGFESKAYGKFELNYIDADGRLYIDLLINIRKGGFRIKNFKLNTVLDFFFGDGTLKDPLTAKDIFKCYKEGTPESMALVGKYCVQDSFAVFKLYEKLQIEIGQTEDAITNKIPMFYLTTQGQQIKTLSQIYHFCNKNNIVVEAHREFDSCEYMGATVLLPKPSIYQKVATLDFASLYPSIIEGHNIDYTTNVPEDNKIVDEEDCHIKEWEEHVNCEHDNIDRKTMKKVICEKNRIRFIKAEIAGKGIIPTTIRELLNARKDAKKQIKVLNQKLYEKYCEYINTLSLLVNKEEYKTDLYNEEKAEKQIGEYSKYIEKMKEKVKDKTIINKFEDEISLIKIDLVVFDKKQNSYKVTANSMYGAMGVKKGKAPFPNGAKTVTYIGRISINTSINLIQDVYNGFVIYGDTDSCMVIFPHLKTLKEISDVCIQISAHTRKIFPSPMSLEFEGEIYINFLILSKKRYIALKSNVLGIVSKKRTEKGVLLSRRDNCEFSRIIYSDIINLIFEKIEPFSYLYLYIKIIKETKDMKEIKLYYKHNNKLVNFNKYTNNRLVFYNSTIPNTEKSFNKIKKGSVGQFYYDNNTSHISIFNIVKKVEVSNEEDLSKFYNIIDKFNLNKDKILERINSYIIDLFSYKYDFTKYIIIKGLTREVDDYKEKEHLKCDDPENCKKGPGPCIENSSVPAQVQLAKKMIKRGIPMQAGDRIEYVLTTEGGIGPKVKQFKKIEDADYYKEFRSVLRLDFLYILQSQIVKPIKDLLQKGLHTTNFIEKLVEYHTNKYIINNIIKRSSYRNIEFQN